MHSANNRMIQRRVWVKGEVQGVGFRVSVRNRAKKFDNLTGYVRNLPDGRVEAVFSGYESEVLELVAWCKDGPPAGRVDQIEVQEEKVDPSLKGFQILS